MGAHRRPKTQKLGRAAVVAGMAAAGVAMVAGGASATEQPPTDTTATAPDDGAKGSVVDAGEAKAPVFPILVPVIVDVPTVFSQTGPKQINFGGDAADQKAGDNGVNVGFGGGSDDVEKLAQGPSPKPAPAPMPLPTPAPDDPHFPPPFAAQPLPAAVGSIAAPVQAPAAGLPTLAPKSPTTAGLGGLLGGLL